MSNAVAQEIQKYVRSLGVSEDFVEQVAHEAEQQFDDWMLVVKLHALLESALIERMLAHMGVGDAAEDFVVGLGMQRRSTYLRLHGVISKTDEKFVAAFGDLRGRFVHAARHTQHVLLTDKFANDKKFDSVKTRLRSVCLPTSNNSVGARNLTPEEFWSEFPEWAIWNYVRLFMYRLSQHAKAP